jgi:hypothetical protein
MKSQETANPHKLFVSKSTSFSYGFATKIFCSVASAGAGPVLTFQGPGAKLENAPLLQYNDNNNNNNMCNVLQYKCKLNVTDYYIKST